MKDPFKRLICSSPYHFTSYKWKHDKNVKKSSDYQYITGDGDDETAEEFDFVLYLEPIET